METKIVVDTRHPAQEIRRNLFGHNLEHTRNCLYGGISAQIIKNRKFANRAQTDGAPIGWYRIGPTSVYLLVHDVDAYVKHFDPKMRARRKDEVHCLAIQNTRGVRGGIGQEKITLQKGAQYELRIAVKSPGTASLNIEFTNYAGTKEYFRRTLKVSSKAWKKEILTFKSPATDIDARLELTFAHKGRLEIGMVSLLPVDNFHGMRRDVVEHLKTIGATMLRWPGGDFVGDYRWQDGLLEVDQRAALQSQMYSTNVHSMGHDFHEIGTDEFIALCREIGAEPFITLNIGWEGADLCTAWHEYCNGGPDTKWGKIRAERGHPEPYNVKHWSIGNEMGSDHMEGPDDAVSYPRAVLPIIKALKKADPSLWLCMSGDWAKKEWFEQSFVKLAPFVESFSVHNYFAMPFNVLGPKVKYEYEWETDCEPQRGIKDAWAARKLMDKYSPKGKPLEISYDEWNAWACWHREPFIVDGIFAAGLINRLLREADGLGMTIACYFQPVNEGCIIVEPFGSRLTSIGLVFEQFKAHAGNHLAKIKSGQRKFLDATASVNPSTGQTVVTIVNSSFDKNFKVKLSPASGNMKNINITTLWAKDHLPGTCFAKRTTRLKQANAAIISLPKFSFARITFE
jgi:alpha-N-arabinofuranosidase